ncbi:hypothetical protein SAMN05421505_101356 [Sinosporangium album]|uniref:Uncharacterized protein n=1 Tax=Sinosporangium album TaxID=504805 RepID=A0A1G7RCX9_9ACTN|nr:hypothetical protein [Sinosporangium album]SDG08641.1 hypothetical protein SAMN05421505_101356 [Sinosporangium album]
MPNQTAAWNAAAVAHLVTPQMRRGELTTVPTSATPLETRWYVTALAPAHRSPAVSTLLDFLAGPTAGHLLRSPETGVPHAHFRPQIHHTLPR